MTPFQRWWQQNFVNRWESGWFFWLPWVGAFFVVYFIATFIRYPAAFTG